MSSNLINLKQYRPLWGLLVLLLVITTNGCSTPTSQATVAAGGDLEVTAAAAVVEVPATWTPAPVVVAVTDEAATLPPPPTSTSVPTSTAVPPTNTPEPTATITTEATATATTPPPTATALPATQAPATQPTTAPTAVPETDAPAPAPASAEVLPAEEVVLGVNLLPNGSFEEGHYLQNGVPELQLPNGWRLEWSEAATGLGDAAWDVYVRPEARVLSTAFLPPEEHPLYIYNGQHTVKIFKGSGAVDFRLMTDVTLQPGTYVIEAKMFADIVEKWENRQKVWAADPTAAEFRFLVGNGGTNWTPQRFGQINVHNFTFTIDEPQTIPVGIGLRGKYAIANNGWFIDDLSVRRVE